MVGLIPGQKPARGRPEEPKPRVIVADESAVRGGAQLRRSILYLDDDAACLDVFGDVFGDVYDVRTEQTLAGARRALAERPPDIVVSDQIMPEISGMEFLREVARTHPQSYRVLLTGALTVGSVVGEIGAGVVHAFVVKPWTFEEMSRVLERAGGPAK